MLLNTSLSQKAAFTRVSGAPTFTAAAQETRLYCLALEAREAYVPGPMGLHNQR